MLGIRAAVLFLLATLGVGSGVAGPAASGASASGYSIQHYGLLWLKVEPLDAHVAVDGEYLDRGVWLISLRPGLHDLLIRKEGFHPYARRLDIGEGKSLRLAVRLQPGSSRK
ncbi:MAG TPA: PEGA domain-containing protein [Fibrobacteria bacterium]|nr:PEGA domain-containing protein [Fibrobacteria bacterium]